MTDELAGGAPAPVETPVVAPEGAAPEAVKPAAETPTPPQEGSEPKGIAKRLKELTDRAKGAEAREDRLFRMLEQERQSRAPAPEAQRKTRAEFNGDDEAWRDHVIAEAETRATEAARRELAKESQEQEKVSRREKFDDRENEFAKTVEDYDEVTDTGPKDNPRWACSEAMADVIEESEEGPALKYFLAQNPDEALKLYRMSPGIAGRAMEKLEARLVAERKKAAAKPVSQAPPPAPSIAAANHGAGETNPGNMNRAQFAKWREKYM